MTSQRVPGDKPRSDEVPPERWSVEMPFDFSDWMGRSVRYQGDPAEYGTPPEPTPPPEPPSISE